MQPRTVRSVTLDGRAVRLSSHCEEQYHQRARPDLPFGEVRELLFRRIREEGSISERRPSWMVSSNPQADSYLVIGGNLALPLRRDVQGLADLVAVTCLFRRGEYGVVSPRPGDA
jgi:hypothetical protein